MKKKMFVMTASILMLAAQAALAGSGSFPLEPTPKGFDVGAQGKAQLSDGRSESLALKMIAKLEDGTVLIVSATMGDGRSVDLGSFSMLLGAGEFSLSNIRDPFSKAFPLSQITAISVGFQGVPLLEGKCGEKPGDRLR